MNIFDCQDVHGNSLDNDELRRHVRSVRERGRVPVVLEDYSEHAASRIRVVAQAGGVAYTVFMTRKDLRWGVQRPGSPNARKCLLLGPSFDVQHDNVTEFLNAARFAGLSFPNEPMPEGEAPPTEPPTEPPTNPPNPPEEPPMADVPGLEKMIALQSRILAHKANGLTEQQIAQEPNVAEMYEQWAERVGLVPSVPISEDQS
jgi:hypothetical protein